MNPDRIAPSVDGIVAAPPERNGAAPAGAGNQPNRIGGAVQHLIDLDIARKWR